MHTLRIKLPDGSDARVAHNSDWSGDALLAWTANGKRHEVTVPGVLLLHAGFASAHRAITTRLVSTLEQMAVEMPPIDAPEERAYDLPTLRRAFRQYLDIRGNPPRSEDDAENSWGLFFEECLRPMTERARAGQPK